ncbi:response regulator transcription factor [Synechococcus sp. CS-602]|uniref:response regulator transcription factor n=1 Tax=Synechococcaceae TaxID=1890426 RepID=UPI0008FF4048|nr:MULTISPECIES: response regulator transcription factor [Synechococcaceae]MCT4365783.1 response regulator transcription factor [Candidatus Regnicoccus frigidus MAG-AL1]APD49074.1 hypothetical protein BM449_13525 [Synechococcus sp. SynAce01]MCT0201030.1 response regulator transcription factor [Synechococcus sp. CS-603]MCT0205547.1 response regulator transcription factor [Synechococcus sp. CS-602]MCT0246916.1 response regulator transcription factor [Synechococcus sp. CS-601]
MDLTPLLARLDQAREQAIALLRDRRLLIASGRRLTISLITGSIGPSSCWIGAATCEQQALALLERERPDLLIVTDPLEQGSGLALVSQAKKRYPDLSILLLLEQDSPDLLLAALESNADGICLERLVGFGNLLAATKAVLGGGAYMDGPVAAMLHRTSRGQIDGSPARLTPRECQVLEELVRGCDNDEIACRLGISPETVRSHCKAVKTKLMARNRTHAAVIALRLQLVRWDQLD